LSATFFAAWRVDGIGGPVLFAGLPENIDTAQIITAGRRFQGHTELKKHEPKVAGRQDLLSWQEFKKNYLRLTP
jgi:hypothetical protein